ncbi:MAG: acetylxylan esterase [Planctomycetes bacterium]|nr:acetylxylan esterase [Planctomycetota bacterium]
MPRRVILMFSILSLFTARSAGADFPAVEKLPSKPELPDPLVMFNGTKVASKEDWVNKRRPELKSLFQTYMYGRLPDTKKVTASLNHEDSKAFGGKGTVREFVLSFDEPVKAKINLLLVVPNERKGPVPVFVGINFSGNHAVLNDPKILLPTSWLPATRKGVKDNKATDEGRGSEVNLWNVDLAIERGYAVALFYNGDLDPDRADKREGVRPYLPRESEPSLDDTATIMTWAWGFHRVIDYLVTRNDLDPKKIVAVGHSRLGKTALLAAAFDERIAIAMPHQAGCGGTAPSRGKVGEQVKQINDRFPHWFNGNFKKFNDDPTKLPFDQHCLVALCAPRPVLFSNAKEDTWANPDGQFEVLQAADPVYRFLGAGGLEAKQRPEIGKLVDSKLGYYYRDGKHSMTRDDWQAFLDFADKQFGKK